MAQRSAGAGEPGSVAAHAGCAFSYQVNRNGPEARRAISAAPELAGQDLDRVDDDLRLAYRVWPESVVYDWCHDQFTPEERQLLLTRVRAQLEIAGGRILETQPQRLSAYQASDSRNVPQIQFFCPDQGLAPE